MHPCPNLFELSKYNVEELDSPTIKVTETKPIILTTVQGHSHKFNALHFTFHCQESKHCQSYRDFRNMEFQVQRVCSDYAYGISRSF